MLPQERQRQREEGERRGEKARGGQRLTGAAVVLPDLQQVAQHLDVFSEVQSGVGRRGRSRTQQDWTEAYGQVVNGHLVLVGVASHSSQVVQYQSHRVLWNNGSLAVISQITCCSRAQRCEDQAECPQVWKILCAIFIHS